MPDGLKAVGLPNRGVIRVAGAEARTFLDNLVTNSLEAVAPGRAVHAALLTPQGKIIADFFVTEADAEAGGGFHLDAPLTAAAELAKRLSFYKLRAKIAVEDLSAELGVAAFWDGAVDADDVALAYADPRLPALGHRLIVHRSRTEAAAEALGAGPAPLEAYHALRARHGVGEPAFDYQLGDAFPHEINMDQLQGIDFKKGCFIGQEVVSRMQHRGTARTRLVPLAYAGGVSVSEGAPVTAGDKPLGRTGTAAGGLGLAMIRIDRAAEAIAAGQAIVAGGVAATPVRPPWWTAAWPLP